MHLFLNKKFLIIFTVIVTLSFFGKIVLATPPGSFFSPGETLNPTCLPTDLNCEVAPPLTAVNIDDTAYGVAWDTDTTHAPSKNALYDKIEGLVAGSHNPVTIGTANGLSLATQVLSLALASTSTTGALSDTDWNTFNNKLSTATATSTYVPYTGATTNVDLGTFSLTTPSILSPIGTALSLSATAPTATTGASQVGVGASLTASNAVASTDTAGAARGGNVIFTPGNAARLTSGNGAPGGFYFVSGTGVGAYAGFPSIIGSDPTNAFDGITIQTSVVPLSWYTNGGAWRGGLGSTGITLAHSTEIGFASSSTLTQTKDTFMRRKGVANPAWGAASATPVAYTHTLAADATGTDIAGANATITPGIGTGIGAASRLLLGGPVLGSTGTTAQSIVTPVDIGGAVYTDGTKSFLNVTGTLPASPSAAVSAVNIAATSAGSTAIDQIGLNVSLLPGHTGANVHNAAIRGNNTSIGGYTTGWIDGYNGSGIQGLSSASTGANTRTGVYGLGSSSVNNGNFSGVGVFGAGGSTYGIGIGVVGKAQSGATGKIGGLFTLDTGSGNANLVAPAGAKVFSALVADNATVAASVFLGRDNGTTVFSIEDGGYLTSAQGGTAGTTKWGVPSATPQAYTHTLATDATGTDIAGANATITPGIGTGAGTAGNLYFATGDVTTTGSGLQAVTTKMTLLGSGYVGIGTTTPRTELELGGDGAILATGTFGSGWTEPTLGAGTRMMWYPRKAAFRAGNVSGTQWNDASIGSYSTAMGKNTTASGNTSTAMGWSTIASGIYSTAMGYFGAASGNYSTAMGADTIASGDYSTVMGNTTTADSYASVALGRYNVGGGTAASWVATDPLFEIGIGTVVSAKANALTVLKNGNVGIGTATPTLAKLQVAGSIGILETGATPTKYTIFQGGDQTIDLTYTLPTAYPAVSGYVLSATDAGVMSWVAGGGGVTNSAGANVMTKSDGTNIVASSLNEATAGVFSTTAGTAALSFVSTAPTATIGASQAGKALTLTASPAVASTDTAGAAAGGDVTITAGAAARLTSGDANGGNIILTPGAGIGAGTSGNVGIGTTTPLSLLDIASGSVDSVKSLGFKETEDNFYFESNFAGVGTTNNWLTMRDWSGNNITTWRGDGNFGIGTVDPDYRLTVNGTSSFTGTSSFAGEMMVTTSTFPVATFERAHGAETTGHWGSLLIKSTTTGNMADSYGAGAYFAIQDSSGIENLVGVFGADRNGADNSGRLFFDTYNAGVRDTKMVITKEGYLGVGTETPTSLLETSGANATIRITDSTGTRNPRLDWIRGTGAFGSDVYADWRIDNNAAKFNFSYQATTTPSLLTVLTLDGSTSDGKVGIGNTSPAAKLDILDTTLAGSGSLAGGVLNLAQTWNTTGTPTAIKLNVTNTASNAASLLLDLQVGASSMFSVSKLGIATIATGLYTPDILGNKTAANVAGNNLQLAYQTFSNSTGIKNAVVIYPYYNQTATAGATDLLINRREAAIGSGTQYLIQAQAGVTGGTDKFWVTNTGGGYFAGNVGIGTTTPTARLHLAAGSDVVNGAPLKLTSGTLTTGANISAGAIEFNNDAFYGTITTGAERKQFAFTTDLTSGYVPYTGATTNVDLGTFSLTTPSILSPVGTALGLSATAPTATIGASQVGVGASLTASNAVASTDTAGAAAGGSVTITAGNAARLTSGNANGGNIVLLPGAGIGTGTAGFIKGSGNVVFTMSADYANFGYLGVGRAIVGVNSIRNAGAFITQSQGGFGISSTTLATGTPDIVLLRKGAANPIWGLPSASPVAYTHTLAADATGTDIAGANATITPGIGTGTGVASRLLLGGPVLGSTGATAQSIVTPVSIGGEVKLDGTESFLNVTGTLPASPSAAVAGVNITMTGAGTASQENAAISATLLAGFTGASLSSAGYFKNLSAVNGTIGTPYGTIGVTGYSAPNSGVMSSIGVLGRAEASNGTAGGVWGVAGIANGQFSNSIGVAGLGRVGSAGAIGLYGFLSGSSAGLAFTTSGAIVGNNGTQTLPIFKGLDNGTTVFSIEDGGYLTSAQGGTAGTTKWGVPAASAQAYTHTLAGNGLGTDIAGANATITPGIGTGAAVSSNLYFATGDVGATGATAQTVTTKMTILGTGLVGIGTTSPRKNLDVLNAGAAQLRLTSTDNSVYGELYADSSGDLRISSTTGNVRLNNENLFVCSGGSCASTVTGEGNLVVETGITLDGGAIITLGENAAIAQDPALSADGKYNGLTRTGTAGTTLAFGDLVYLDPTDSRWELADANAAAGADGDATGILGMVVQAAAADGSATTILLNGTIRADAAFPAMTVNATMYVSETAGDITDTQPTTTDAVIKIMGFPLTADELYFNPSNEYFTHI